MSAFVELEVGFGPAVPPSLLVPSLPVLRGIRIAFFKALDSCKGIPRLGRALSGEEHQNVDNATDRGYRRIIVFETTCTIAKTGR